MTTLLVIVLYVLNVLLNRWMYFILCKHDDDWYPNPPFVFALFLGPFGTVVTGVLLLGSTKNSFFTPPHLRDKK